MTYTFTLSWWLVPLMATIIFLTIAWIKSDSKGSIAYDFFTPLYDIARFAFAIVASLISWLIYFIIF